MRYGKFIFLFSTIVALCGSGVVRASLPGIRRLATISARTSRLAPFRGKSLLSFTRLNRSSHNLARHENLADIPVTQLDSVVRESSNKRFMDLEVELAKSQKASELLGKEVDKLDKRSKIQTGVLSLVFGLGYYALSKE